MTAILTFLAVVFVAACFIACAVRAVVWATVVFYKIAPLVVILAIVAIALAIKG
jgi:hypothetical protein